MKTAKKYLRTLTLGLIPALIFLGCSTTKYMRDYSSKEKFNQKVNNDFDGRTAYVETKDDSAVHTGFLVVTGDTLLLCKDTIKVESGTLSKTDIENIQYDDNTFSSGLVFLKNKSTINAYYMVLSKDSVFYKKAKAVRNVMERIPLKKIKTAFYKTYWPGIISGTIAFAAAGWLSGVIIGSGKRGRDIGGFYDFLNVGGGGVIGAITGGILGAVFPHNHVYIFDPRQ